MNTSTQSTQPHPPAFLAELHITLSHDRKFNIVQQGDVGAILSLIIARLGLSK